MDVCSPAHRESHASQRTVPPLDEGWRTQRSGSASCERRSPSGSTSRNSWTSSTPARASSRPRASLSGAAYVARRRGRSGREPSRGTGPLAHAGLRRQRRRGRRRPSPRRDRGARLDAADRRAMGAGLACRHARRDAHATTVERLDTLTRAWGTPGGGAPVRAPAPGRHLAGNEGRTARRVDRRGLHDHRLACRPRGRPGGAH